MTTLLDKRGATPEDAAPGVETHDVKAVNRADERQLYASRQKIYARLAHGRFRTIKWIVLAVTLGIYYALPWIRWPRGAELPDQAVLADVANGRLFVGPIEIWPQEFYYVTFLLVIGALFLFLVTAVAGRVWCGYTCPQTVWTDLMIAVERFWQGDRNARMRLDKEPWGVVKIYKKAMTHVSWLLIGLLTGGAFVFYFRDAPTLFTEFVTGTAPAIAYLFLGLFTFTTYLLGGIAREQVCIYMCPWPRIQGAMTDGQTLLVSYRNERGEPRGPARKGSDGKVDWSTRGDCIDCNACVAVCPTGIDIRDGSQLECIQCALCIDACNDIMDRIERPRGLIAYDTIAMQEAKAAGGHAPLKIIRPRTMLYAGILGVVTLVMVGVFLNKTVLEINVLRDRNPSFVQLSDGGVRNGYTVKILNKEHEPRTFALTVQGLNGAGLSAVGLNEAQLGKILVPTDNLREIRVYVSVPPEDVASLATVQTPFDFVVRDTKTGTEVLRRTNFQRPQQ